jgi:hypothetical protein
MPPCRLLPKAQFATTNIDTGVATSIENFWNGKKAQRERRTSERFGYLAHELRLAITRRAVEAMNSSLNVESHPGRGCSCMQTFPLALPTRRSSLPPAPSSATVEDC